MIRWGVIGLGKIANKFVTDLQTTENCELVAVASRDKNKAREFAHNSAAPYYFGSYDELIDSGFVDIVYIATPHTNHAELSIQCLKKGIAVLCEKPMAMSYKDAEIVINTAKENNTFFMEAMWTRFIPAFEELYKKIIVEKLIGDIQYIKADFGFDVPYDADSRIFNKNLGASALLDVGIYPVYLANTFLGYPDKILSANDINEEGVDRTNNILFHYKNDAMASLFSSFAIRTKTEATIYGSLGTAYLFPRFHHTKTFSIHYKNGINKAFHYPYLGYGYSFEINEVNNCLMKKKIQSKKMSWEHSLSLAKLLEEIRNGF
jgi:predicted dehydrogenase